MADTYQYKKGSISLGPYTLEKMQSLARQGVIGRHHHISKSGGPFQPGDQFPELFQLSSEALKKSGAPKTKLWHYTISGERQEKPAPEEQLINLIGKSVVQPIDMVWNESVGDKWVSVSSVPQFAAAIPAVDVRLAEPIEERGRNDYQEDQRQIREPAGENYYREQGTAEAKSFNALGLAGFICSVVAIVLLTIPCFVFIVAAESLFWSFHIVVPFTIVALIGLVLSSIGLTKVPRGMATTGTIIGVVALTMGIVAFLGWVFLPHRIAMERRTLIDSRIADIKINQQHLNESLTSYQNVIREDGESKDAYDRKVAPLRRDVGRDAGKLITAYSDQLTVTAKTSEFSMAFDGLSRLEQSLKKVEDAGQAVEEASLRDILDSANVNVQQLRNLMDTLNLYQRGELTFSQAEAKMTGL